jgi:regulator of protease activity HflC (stomatin/prohibitin superfamily)
VFVTIIVILLVIVGLLVAIGSAIGGEGDGRGGGIAGGVFLVLIGIVVWGFVAFTQVKATEVGVPVTFGKVGAPLESGVHWVKPWTNVEKFPIRPLTTEQQVGVRTAEGGKVTAQVAARWVVIKEKASETYFQARTGDDDEIQKRIVDPNLRQAVNTVYSGKTNIDAANDRTEAPDAILTEARRLLAPYGIDVTTVLLRQVDPDDGTARAVAQFAAEQQKTRIAEQAKLTAIQQAAANLEAAKGLKAAAGELPNLSPEQAVQVCAQTWERMAAKAIEAGVSLYTSPCGSGATVAAAGK